VLPAPGRECASICKVWPRNPIFLTFHTLYTVRISYGLLVCICIPVCLYSHALQEQKPDKNSNLMQNVHVVSRSKCIVIFQMVHLFLV
jgi:hypothetical protein